MCSDVLSQEVWCIFWSVQWMLCCWSAAQFRVEIKRGHASALESRESVRNGGDGGGIDLAFTKMEMGY